MEYVPCCLKRAGAESRKGTKGSRSEHGRGRERENSEFGYVAPESGSSVICLNPVSIPGHVDTRHLAQFGQPSTLLRLYVHYHYGCQTPHHPHRPCFCNNCLCRRVSRYLVFFKVCIEPCGLSIGLTVL